MARAAIARTALPVTGFNLTDATYTTMALGASNGVEAPYRAGDLLILNNSTAGASVYTIKVAQPAAYVQFAVTVPDITVNVGAAKMVVVPVADLMNQAAGVVQVDCSVAGKIAVLAVNG